MATKLTNNLTKQESSARSDMNKDLQKLFGVTKIPTSLDHKKEIRKILSSKRNKSQ